MTAIERSADGRFVKGSGSPNPKGRPRSAVHDPVPVPAALREVILGVANTEVSVRLPGRRQNTRMSLFEARVIELGSGKPSNRAALTGFIRLVQIAAEPERPPKRPQPVYPDDYLELWDAQANGPDAEYEAAVARLNEKLPGVEDLSDDELLARLAEVRAWQSD